MNTCVVKIHQTSQAIVSVIIVHAEVVRSGGCCERIEVICIASHYRVFSSWGSDIGSHPPS